MQDTDAQIIYENGHVMERGTSKMLEDSIEMAVALLESLIKQISCNIGLVDDTGTSD